MLHSLDEEHKSPWVTDILGCEIGELIPQDEEINTRVTKLVNFHNYK